MWPWLMIAAGVLMIVGGLVVRHRMMRDFQSQHAQQESVEPAKDAPEVEAAPEAARATPAAQQPSPLPFPDRPPGHQLTPPPMLRARSSDIPLLDWLRYYSDGNAWSGVIQSISDRISGDPMLKPYFGAMDRPTLQRHVMSTVMEISGEGLTVGTVRRMADAHLKFVSAGGDPLPEPVWDKLVATAANALREHFVPESAVAALDDTLAPLRSVIVSSTPR